MKETRDMQFFEDTAKALATKQNETRDEVLDAVLVGDYSGAESKLKELQTISVGIQVCHQTILRDRDRVQQEAAATAPQPPAPVIPLRAVSAPAPKKKGFFSRLFG